MGFAFSALVGENSCALSTAAIRRGMRVDNSNAQEEALRARAQAEYAKLREQMRRQDGESLKGASKAARTAAPAASGAAPADSRPSGVGGERLFQVLEGQIDVDLHFALDVAHGYLDFHRDSSGLG